MFTDSPIEEINVSLEKAWNAFHVYRKFSLKQRADFMRSIAVEIENCGDALIQIAMAETNLSETRLKAEKTRTIFQLNSYANFCESGQWMDIRIDTSDTKRTPAKPDLRKMMAPLGPVVVFGAANFPFAYSTAGGDTASAFAAGCPVIVKAHPGHAQTSEIVANAIFKAAASCNMPDGIFSHVHGASTAVGEALVKHLYTKAVGFTGSFAGGKQLFDWGNQRQEPIPVFCEMSSVNPVFLLPEKMKSSAAEIARLLCDSITLSAGQFCTNPGIVIGINNADFEIFTRILTDEIKNVVPASMLNRDIYENYRNKREMALQQDGVVCLTGNSVIGIEAFKKPLPGLSTTGSSKATIALVDAKKFIANPLLQEEVFGPYSILVSCNNMDEMKEVARHMRGQLTATLMASENDIRNNELLVDTIKNLCGRFILNAVPTGVEVCLAMQHGGPFPATTDSRFTAVGGDAIKRFARPVTFQNWANSLLPDELKNENPLHLYRTVNNNYTNSSRI